MSTDRLLCGMGMGLLPQVVPPETEKANIRIQIQSDFMCKAKKKRETAEQLISAKVKEHRVLGLG